MSETMKEVTALGLALIASAIAARFPEWGAEAAIFVSIYLLARREADRLT